MNSAGNGTYIYYQSPTTTLNGTGTINMSNTTANVIWGSTNTNRLVIGSGYTLQGSAQLGANSGRFTNQGLIYANQSQPIIIDPLDGAGGFINDTTGILQVGNGGSITFNNGSYTNNGIFRANAGSTLNMTVAVDGTGGYHANGGKIQMGAFTVGSPGATGAITVANGGELELNGTTLYGGTVTVAAAFMGAPNVDGWGALSWRGSESKTRPSSSARWLSAAISRSMSSAS